MLRPFAILLLSALIMSCSPRKVSPEQGASFVVQNELVITDSLLRCGGSDTLRLGRMGSGEQLSTWLTLTNKTSNPAVVLGHELTCGCIKLSYDNKPIVPNTSMKINVDFDSRGLFGWQMKLFRLRLHGAQSPIEIFVEAEVE